MSFCLGQKDMIAKRKTAFRFRLPHYNVKLKVTALHMAKDDRIKSLGWRLVDDMRFFLAAISLCSLIAVPAVAQLQTPPKPAENSVWLDSLNIAAIQQDYGTPHVAKTVNGNPLTLGGIIYPHGVGTHANSICAVDLHGDAKSFEAIVGVDDERTGQGAVEFDILVDGKLSYKTPVMHGGDKPQTVHVALDGAQKLTLLANAVGGTIDNDHADWANAFIALQPGASTQPIIVSTADNSPARLIIPPISKAPEIHGARIIGTTPGRPFLFLIPATGTGPLRYSATPLPRGLTLDSTTGIISGEIAKPGKHIVALKVSGPFGETSRSLTIVGAPDSLALTPPMGWNSWNSWAGNIDDAKMRATADVMISSGLAAHGYQYVNIDDTWEGKRDAAGNIQGNEKFPDMHAMTAYIHAKGLKAGIYSSPGPKTCAGYEACYQHEDQDAATYAAWGFDYLKYDWCSYGEIAKDDHSLPVLEKPYAVMRSALDKTDRDIVYSLCQYGMGDVWKWGADPSIGGNCWRTTGDINDHWASLHGIYESQNGHEVFAGPGHWNDPDMLVVGQVGWGNPHPSHLTQNEQILHISMWCLLSAPLLIGCDLSKLDPFTLALLTNDEAIDIDQDPLGKAARKLPNIEKGEVWTRPLYDGTIAVGLVNPSPYPQTVTVTWSDLGLSHPQIVRDLWLHKNVGRFESSYSVEVPTHGAVLLRLTQAR